MKKQLLRDMNRLECDIAIQDLDLEIAGALIGIDMASKDMVRIYEEAIGLWPERERPGAAGVAIWIRLDRLKQEYEERFARVEQLEGSLPKLRGRIKSIEKAIRKIEVQERQEQAWCRTTMGLEPNVRKGMRKLEELSDDFFA